MENSIVEAFETFKKKINSILPFNTDDKTSEVDDKINSPSHYKLDGLDIESVDVIKSVLGKEKFKGWCWGNSLKYLIRHEKKNGVEDLKKAKKNLDWLIEERDN